MKTSTKIIAIILLITISLIFTFGFIYLIAWCFGLKVNLKIAFGIWLLVYLINLFLSGKK